MWIVLAMETKRRPLCMCSCIRDLSFSVALYLYNPEVVISSKYIGLEMALS